MKNVNIFIDVDLTLVDANGRVLDGAIDALKTLKERGCHLFLWSTVGMEYAKSTAERLGIFDLFDSFAAKPDVIIDDMPSTVLNPFHFDVNQEGSWSETVRRLVSKHVD